VPRGPDLQVAHIYFVSHAHSKCVELQEIIFKTANISIHPMAKRVEFLEFRFIFNAKVFRAPKRLETALNVVNWL
jgi:hypothetical protein